MKLNQVISNITFSTKIKDVEDNIINSDYYFYYLHNYNDVTTSELFENKKVLVFGIPNVWRDIDSTQIKSVINNIDSLKELGIDDVYFISCFESHTLAAYEALTLHHAKYISDINLELTNSLEMNVKFVDQSTQGKGNMTWRYALLLENKMIKNFWIEDNYLQISSYYPIVSNTSVDKIIADLNLT